GAAAGAGPVRGPAGRIRLLQQWRLSGCSISLSGESSMTQAGQGKVTVRVEVVIEGLQTGATPVVVAAGGQRAVERRIDRPQPSPQDTPVFRFGGVNCIEASGGSAPVGGHMPVAVWARAYPSPTIDPTQSQFAQPPSDAV